MSTHVAIYGLGPIGTLIAKTVLEKEDLSLVAAFEVDPNKIGKDISEVIELSNKTGIIVSKSSEVENILKKENVDIVLHSTSTYLEKIYPQIVKCIKSEVDIISTSETLANPWYCYPELATLIDEMAKKYCVTVLGTGINPGFILDILPSVMTAICSRVDHIYAIRSLDASKRRYSFQKKIGLGLDIKEFNEKMSKGELTAHVGYGESVDLIAAALGIKLDKIDEIQEPLIADKHLKTEYFNIEKGKVSGIRGYGIGYLNNKEFIKIELYSQVGAEEYEEVIIKGNPSIKWKSSGTPGDISTAAMVVNMIPKVLKAQPGLLRMIDLPIPSAFLHL